MPFWGWGGGCIEEGEGAYKIPAAGGGLKIFFIHPLPSSPKIALQPQMEGGPGKCTKFPPGMLVDTLRAEGRIYIYIYIENIT